MYSTPNLFSILFTSAQLLGKPLLLGSTLSLNNLQLVRNRNVHCHKAFIKSTICSVHYVRRFLKKIGDLMVNYLKSYEKQTFDIPYFTFNLYSNIVVPSSVLLDVPSSKRGVVEEDFRLWNKVSSISTSSLSWFCWNASSDIPSMAWLSHNKSSIPTSTSLPPSPTCE